MRYTLSSLIVCALALCSVGFAQKGQAGEKPDPNAKPIVSKTQNWRVIPVNVGPRNPSQYVPYSDFFPASGGTVDVDVTGTPSYDGTGASCNVRLTVAAPSGKDAWTGIGWDVTLTAYDPSWLSEIAVLITNVDGDGYILVPGAGDDGSGTSSYSSGGVNDLCGAYNLPPLPLPDGNLYLEFYETYNDFADCGQDGNWDSGTLTFAFGSIPPFTGYDEQGDAGDLPETAQATPSGVLSAIRGTLSADDVDMYAIYITDPSSFSATTSCQTDLDTQIFLFDANGNPVVFNDDDPNGGFASRIDNSAFCIPSAGLYYLAITAYDRDPTGCNGGEQWADTPFGTIRCADGADQASRISGWTGSHGDSGTYIVSITGAEGASPGDPDDCPPFQGWDEFNNGGGDAGDVPSNAQPVYSADRTPCQDPVTRITGQRAATDDADMFVICITDPANFVASSAGSSFDTQLWLFRCDGTGVVHNDDYSGVQSQIDNSTGCLNGLQAGTYLIAITGYNQDPVDANGNTLWNNTPFGDIRCPDGPGAANPMVGWTGTGGSGSYRITLTGAYFVSDSGCDQGPSCEGDVNNDGQVDDADLLVVLFNFGCSGFGCEGDLNNDATVDDADLLIVLFNFGCGS
ncbi:MAG: hypothetical protein KatS3mg020_0786 [Fimbriimonadales bacterium]|nr:MAG: hypothetical protein KatS3mg020_0786 [Fimbriimonadales bacterium]